MIVKLNSKQHPLLRATEVSAITKMSRAAVNVGLIADDPVGRGCLVNSDRQRHLIYTENVDTGARARKVEKTSTRSGPLVTMC